MWSLEYILINNFLFMLLFGPAQIHLQRLYYEHGFSNLIQLLAT